MSFVTCEEKFSDIYSRELMQAFCPYRICPLGAHIDHQFGMVQGFALNYGVHMAYGIKKGGIVELISLNFPKRVQFHVNSVPEEKDGVTGAIIFAERQENSDASILFDMVSAG